jgi:Flp pilus assembly protein TadG
VNRLLRDPDGSVMVEITIVLPLLLLVALGTIDVTYLLYDWALANKAAFAGARAAIVADPVASGIADVNSLSWTGSPGDLCFNSSNGTTNGNCPSISTVCTPGASSGGTCSDGSTFDNAAFCRIFTGDSTCPAVPLAGSMKKIFPRLQRQNVQISYKSNGLGFVGRPSGVPMTVTVSVNCMTHDFYFLTGLMRYFTPDNAWGFQDCAGDAASGPTIPRFATTLPSEDMATD